jgi:hypothetical protein
VKLAVRQDTSVKGTRPELPGAKELLPSTREWWATVWSSPMAVVYLEADVPALARLAVLVDRLERGEGGGGARLLAEVRSLEDRFGLSPLARRRLQWEIEQATGEHVDQSTSDGDERWLRVV